MNDAQRTALFSGKHPRLGAPRDDMSYGFVVDVGGQAETQMDDDELRMEQPDRDSTMCLVLEWDPREIVPTLSYPDVRIVNAYWWTGEKHLEAAEKLVALAQHWHVSDGAIDARGLGEAQAMHLHSEVPCIEAYAATSPDVSADCYDLLARLNQGKVRMWRADPAQDPEYREILEQARHTRYEIRSHDLMRLTKPTGTRSTGKHIDAIKAMTYTRHAIAPAGRGTSTPEQPSYRGARDPFGSRQPLLRRGFSEEEDDDATS
jgi:hypothetical protein